MRAIREEDRGKSVYAKVPGQDERKIGLQRGKMRGAERGSERP